MSELPLRGFVKICGVTNVDDALVVASSGADALGLIFAESPRRITKDQARAVLDATRGALLRCAVFRSNDDDFVLEHLEGLDVEMVQVHGTLSDQLVTALERRSLLIVKALSVDSEEFFNYDESRVQAVLVDGPFPGSGQVHAWDLLASRQFRVPVIAAGGLNADNVAGTIKLTSCWGVDCASGVEAAAGRKDHALVRRFVAIARATYEELEV